MNELFTAHLEDAAIAARFNDAAWIEALVRVEAALARAQAAAGVIPESAAARITERASSFSPDIARLAVTTERDGFPIIGLLEQLRAHVGDDAARWLHWGATTQDILDNAMMVQLAGALGGIEQRMVEVSMALARLAHAHRHTLMVGRTHLQPALPIPFGLKAAGWLAPFARHRRRLVDLRGRALTVQFGGAAGTLASLGARGLAVMDGLAADLGLRVPSMPWHAQRDNVHEIGGWLALVAASAGKFTQDVLLLTQPEIGELGESPAADRGGSSAMPQKSNPVRSEAILVAARLAAHHHAGLLSAPAPEHERGTQNIQLESVHLPRLCALTGGALRAAEMLARELVVEVDRMRANLDATHGILLGEACVLALSRHLEAGAARALVREACARASAEKRHLVEILRARPEVRPALNELPKDEADYLGVAQDFIDRVLAEARLPNQ